MDQPQKIERFCSSATVLRNLTLRRLNDTYRDHRGCFWRHAEPSELSGGKEKDTAPCMNRFINYVGHPSDRTFVGLEPSEVDGAYDLIGRVAKVIESSVDQGYLWVSPEFQFFVRHEREDSWTRVGGYGHVDEQGSKVLSVVEKTGMVPLSVNSVHGAMEVESLELAIDGAPLMMYPRDAIPSTGLIGTLHNNQSVDMVPWDNDKVPMVKDREYRDDYVGFICAGHTSHSTEAGRMRRLTSECTVRIFTSYSARSLTYLRAAVKTSNASCGDWTLFCLGLWTRTEEGVIKKLCARHRRARLAGDYTYSLHIDCELKVCVLSVSSGVVMKLDSYGYFTDNVELYKSDHLSESHVPHLDTTGGDMIRACFSTFFSLVPFISSDRAPRPSISSAQLPQAVCLPFCPATAAVSPCYVFDPVLKTPYVDELTTECKQGEYIADCYPGENPLVLYFNDEDSYEDAMYVSSKYVDLGGFSTVSTCRYVLPHGDPVPEPNQKMCRVLFPWWKNPCDRYCRHTKEWTMSNGRFCSTQRTPTGRAISSIMNESGEWTVLIKSYQQLQTGDKITTGHGQKGVAKILRVEDMPQIVLEDGETMIPDVVVAMSSIICRQTNGQLYDAQASLNAVRDGKSKVVRETDIPESFDECYVMDSRTGKMHVTWVYEDGDMKKPRARLTRASFGFPRMFNQTQMTRERHFTFSRDVGPGNLRTPTRRSRGGGVTFGEMEVQAACAAGLSFSVAEITSRGDRVSVEVCRNSQRLRLLCPCTNHETVTVHLPYDTVLTDCMTAIIHGASYIYKCEPRT